MVQNSCLHKICFQVLSEQMEHATWAGFHFEDLIFPLFMFISGVTILLAILSKLEKGASKKEVIVKITKRMIVLVLLAVFFCLAGWPMAPMECRFLPMEHLMLWGYFVLFRQLELPLWVILQDEYCFKKIPLRETSFAFY